MGIGWSVLYGTSGRIVRVARRWLDNKPCLCVKIYAKARFACPLAPEGRFFKPPFPNQEGFGCREGKRFPLSFSGRPYVSLQGGNSCGHCCHRNVPRSRIGEEGQSPASSSGSSA